MATWTQDRAKGCAVHSGGRTQMAGWSQDESIDVLRRSGVQPWRQQTGFTLLEVLVAVAIVAIVLVTLLHLHARSLDATIHAQDLTTAVLLAQTKMAALGPAPTPGEEQGVYDDPELNRFRWATAVVDHALNPPGGLPVTVLHMVVTIFWADGQQQRHYTLESYASQ
jgi:general secretion pathway protein I